MDCKRERKNSKRGKSKETIQLITQTQHVLDTLVCLVATCTNVWFKIHIRSLLKYVLGPCSFTERATLQVKTLIDGISRFFVFSSVAPFLSFPHPFFYPVQSTFFSVDSFQRPPNTLSSFLPGPFLSLSHSL